VFTHFDFKCRAYVSPIILPKFEYRARFVGIMGCIRNLGFTSFALLGVFALGAAVDAVAQKTRPTGRPATITGATTPALPLPKKQEPPVIVKGIPVYDVRTAAGNDPETALMKATNLSIAMNETVVTLVQGGDDTLYRNIVKFINNARANPDLQKMGVVLVIGDNPEPAKGPAVTFLSLGYPGKRYTGTDISNLPDLDTTVREEHELALETDFPWLKSRTTSPTPNP
jgi:hypothetical protein